MSEDPHALFEAWFSEARESEPNDPEAMCVSTVDAAGRPSSRMVLLKGHDDRGFVFYTNLGSRKGGELAANPRVALLFHWKSLRRQIRIEGAVAQADDAEADAYFASRSRASQLGAWASEQSRALPARAALDDRYLELTAHHEGRDVPRPPHWHGFRVTPEYFEFWQDGAHRLHERRTFVAEAGGWGQGMLHP